MDERRAWWIAGGIVASAALVATVVATRHDSSSTVPTAPPATVTSAPTGSTSGGSLPTIAPTVATTIGPTGSTTGAPGDEAELADPNFFVDALPALATMPAPPWVQQGTRITYYSSAASVANSYHRYVEDQEGNWIDPETGTRYRQEDISGAAGHGYNQVTVTELNSAVAALSVHAYVLADLALDSPVTTVAWSGVIGLPGAGSDYWLHPDVLATVDGVVTDSLKIVRMPYTIGDRTFDSLWVQSLGDTANFTWVYDTASGILLHTASSTQGPPITGPVAQGEGRQGSTFLTQSTLVDVRTLVLPWAFDAAPDWVATTSHLQYEGSVQVTDSVSLGVSLAVDTVDTGTNWARYAFARTMWSDVSPSVTEYAERVDGPGQVGAMWLPPGGLGALVAGQELDRDPVTAMVTAVLAVDASGDGVTVTIREEGPGEVSDFVYDGGSGVLLASTYTDLRLGTVTYYELTDWS